MSWDGYINRNLSFWKNHSSRVQLSDDVILVDCCHDSRYYVHRNLTIAKFMQLITGGRIVALMGMPFKTNRVDVSALEAHIPLIESYGVETIIPLPMLEDLPDGDHFVLAEALGFDVGALARLDPDARKKVQEFEDADGVPIGHWVYDTLLRSSLEPSLAAGDNLARWFDYVTKLAAWARKTVEDLNIRVFVTGHIDYAPWGVVSNALLTNGGKVVYQKTDSRANLFVLNADRPAGETLQGQVRRLEADAFRQFETGTASQREQVVRAAQRDSIAKLEGFRNLLPAGLQPAYSSPEGADYWRNRLFGQDSKPIVCLFTHTLTDIVTCDESLFTDYLDWLEVSLAHVAKANIVNLFVKVHPLNAQYDRAGTLQRLQTEFEKFDNIRFSAAEGPSRRAVAEFCILGTTVRGTAGYEMPVYGLPMVLAGKSNYSETGLVMTPADRSEYFAALDLKGPGLVDRDTASLYYAFTEFWARPISGFLLPYPVYHSDLGYIERSHESAVMHRLEEDDVLASLRAAWQSGGGKVVSRHAANLLYAVL